MLKSETLPAKIPANALEGYPILRDPHHRGANEWCYAFDTFWIRTAYSHNRWSKVKRIHITAARIRTLAKLVELNK